MPKQTIGLRQFICLLEAGGRLKRVTRQVDWKFELGEITRGNQLPLLFENIKDYPGHCVFTNGLSHISTIAAALGCTPDISRKVLISELRARVSRPVKPVLVDGSAVFAKVFQDQTVDLLQLPIPQWSDQETGRYLGTWHINVTQDPENGRRNVGVYRMQVLGPNTATVSTSPQSHIGRHLAKAEKQGRPLEMAVAIGVPECVIMAAGAAYPCGCDEYELAGALQANPIDLIPCQTVSLEVPAEAEIVIEGELKPGVRVKDGPYFDYSGKTNINPNAFVFEARRLMFRHRPIFRGAAIGVAGAEDHQMFAVLSELDLVDFHGRRIKQAVQNQLLKRHLLSAFQWSGKLIPGMAGVKTGKSQ